MSSRPEQKDPLSYRSVGSLQGPQTAVSKPPPLMNNCSLSYIPESAPQILQRERQRERERERERVRESERETEREMEKKREKKKLTIYKIILYKQCVDNALYHT